MLKQVYSFAILTRLVTVSLGLLTYYFIGSYDSSAEIQTGSTNVLNAFLRWDALYFLHIAEHGYVYEQETAFFPVLPLLTRLLAHTRKKIYRLLKREINVVSVLSSSVSAGFTVSTFVFWNSNIQLLFYFSCRSLIQVNSLSKDIIYLLYRLTLAVLPRQKKLAFTSSIAFCLSPPSMFMSSFYTESIFSLFSFTGMHFIAKRQYFLAALIWGVASGIRSNAIIFAGFFFYDLIWIRSIKRLVRRMIVYQELKILFFL